MDNEHGDERPSKNDAQDGLNQIRADRACIGCGFNLFGQSVVKEEHYDLAIVRCPECGVVGALQSYPTMSHWVNRFRALLTALWILVLIGAFSIYTMIVMGFSAGALEIASDDFGSLIGSYHAQWVEEQASLAQEAQQAWVEQPMNVQADEETGITGEADKDETGVAVGEIDESALQVGTVTSTTNGVTTTVTTNADGTTTTTVNGVMNTNWVGGGYQWSMITPIWRDRHLEQAIDDAGGIWANLDRGFLVIFIPGFVVSLMAGLFWSVTMLGARRRTVVWVPVIAGLIAGAMSMTINSTSGTNVWASELAKAETAPIVIPMIIGFQILIAALGVFIGRKVARTVVLMTLPPQGRVSLSMLWTRDGLEMPRPKMR